MKRIAIIGSRDYANLNLVVQLVKSFKGRDYILVTGTATGVDEAVMSTGKAFGIPVASVAPQYKLFPVKYAPIERNRSIAMLAEEMHAFWDGKSTGTKNAMDNGKKLGIPVTVHGVDSVYQY